MALVLGLLTSTMVLAFAVKSNSKAGETYYLKDSVDPYTEWRMASSWHIPGGTSPSCSGPNEIPCRVDLDIDEELIDFLGEFNDTHFDEFRNDNKVTQKADN